jgi:8-oxo-dGTP pyrophosphatase MutT (NUDIX family)
MTPSARLLQQITAITPVDDRERDSIDATLEWLARPGDPYDQGASDHHVTASAFVVSPRGVILHRHLHLGIWVQPGGHVDPGEEPEQAALRETIEETGLPARLVTPVHVFHVDVHAGPRGHTHFDLRYILAAPPVEPAPPAGESPDVFWFDFDAALERCEPSLVPALAKLVRVCSIWNVEDLAGE